MATDATLVDEAGTEIKRVLNYPVTDEALVKLREECFAIKVSGPDDAAGHDKAKSKRTEVRTMRTTIDRVRKAHGEEAREWLATVNGKAKSLMEGCKEIEAHLAAQEKIVLDERNRIKREAAEAKERMVQDRMNDLAAVGCVAFARSTVEVMDDTIFQSALIAATAKHQSELEAEADRKRLAEEEAERQRVEAAKLAADRAALEAEKLAAEQERQRVETERQESMRLEREEMERQQAAIQADRDRLEAERVAAEQEREKAAAAERAVVEERERAEREKAERLAAEVKAIDAAEAERVRQEQLRPDREKLMGVSRRVGEIVVPDMSGGSESLAAADLVEQALREAQQAIVDIAESF